MYLTYAEYLAMGGTLSEPDYNGFELEAETRIDWYTFNRLHSETEYPQRVKQCVFTLVRLAQTKANLVDGASVSGTSTASAAIASQSNDGVSISYNTVSASAIFDDLRNETAYTIHAYLSGVTNSMGRKLLFRGVYPDDE